MRLQHLIVMTLAGAALACPAQAAAPDLAALNAAVRPGLAASAAPAQAPAGLAEGAFQRITMLKTAIDRPLSSDGLTASLGLLCGRQPNRDISGGAGAFDKDAEGKFLGAQLRRAF